MKRRIFSLVVGLIVILAAPAFIQSCVHKAENAQKTEIVAPSGINAKVSTLVYKQVPEVANCTNIAYKSVQDQPATVVTEESGSGVNTWAIVIGAVLSILSIFFGAQYTKASKVLKAIASSVDKNSPGGEKITVAEIQGIIQAFKGTA